MVRRDRKGILLLEPFSFHPFLTIHIQLGPIFTTLQLELLYPLSPTYRDSLSDHYSLRPYPYAKRHERYRMIKERKGISDEWIQKVYM